MSLHIEDPDEDVRLPSLLELRALIQGRFRTVTAEAGEPWDLAPESLNALCIAMFHLVGGDRGKRIYLEHVSHALEWDEDEVWLDSIAREFPDLIMAIRMQVDTWFERFWDSGASSTQWPAFRDAVSDTMLEVLATQSRQHILACYGESA
jgi:hypothetical protein